MDKYCVLGGFPRLHFADVLHVLELPELGQRVVPQRLVERRVAVLVLHVQLGLGPHQQLWGHDNMNALAQKTGRKTKKDSGDDRKTSLILCYSANATVADLYGCCEPPQCCSLSDYGLHFCWRPQGGDVAVSKSRLESALAARHSSEISAAGRPRDVALQ